ncbi:putative Late embryogenesis abundant protein [Helianthus annuus]|uniref:Late embryogenesis abundant protein, LEA_2 subgroup n=1 Tax=Helianthus annuus TaxID=4232 RepID=A0A251SZR6_HELAN|nr:NDR1/HIN1-like protein 1 [Helianthus annuus]KAF5775285.1 putative Late embryogenesis abundant protein, LEA_2 subgroup [Helianthus annuus]KAJ0483223.1 putative Late embryogenesis abundant protein [Helianthus annuus]KAJ0499350.1 putative Late embryogenesis abundant protein [Helianthus annuus]KAJ0665370.1 putative Late embryogenesis abundant protein [Helianthus annuus]KAJ0672758.1 putative Late embryogenesis abundant protein [Helianthus annuus]
MSAKDGCGHHHDYYKRRKFYYHVMAAIIALIILILFVILLIYLILRPTKPTFTLQDITLYAFNISTTTTTLTSNLQITISSRNPNSRIGIYYDKLDVYATYRNQQITLPTMIPPTYQGHKDVNVWSPYLYGNEVPVAPYLAMSLAEDETAGTVLVNVRAIGRVRWKVGTFVSATYRLNVNCPAYITFGNKNNGFVVGPAVKYQVVEGCNVDV